MTVNDTVPTLLLYSTTSCPRCEGRRILAHAVSTESQFAWHECHECGYLWAIPSWSDTARGTTAPPVDAGRT